MENLMLPLELRHIFAQEFHVILCPAEYWTDAFLSRPMEELRNNTRVFT